MANSPIKTRLGYKTLFRLPDGNAQGMTSFTPTGGPLTLVMTVNGKIYVSTYPFSNYMQATNYPK